jgi:hypothetical protein
MENKLNNISFALKKLTTEQFAIIEDSYSETAIIRLSTNIRSGADESQKMVAVFSSFTFEADNKPFIVIEAGCHFQIEEKEWDEMLKKDTHTLIVPKGFMSHLAMLTVGTTRGILHAKTEGTCFNKFMIPPINVAEMFTENTIFTFNAQ